MSNGWIDIERYFVRLSETDPRLGPFPKLVRELAARPHVAALGRFTSLFSLVLTRGGAVPREADQLRITFDYVAAQFVLEAVFAKAGTVAAPISVAPLRAADAIERFLQQSGWIVDARSLSN